MRYYRTMTDTMLAIEPARIGKTYHWLIADLMTRRSGDVTLDIDGDTWEERWAEKLDDKRADDCYNDVMESLRANGFVRPLDATTTFRWEDDNPGVSVRLADGHHRFAAAIDLGMETVPVLVSAQYTVAPDSGEWSLGNPISTRAGISYHDCPYDYSGVSY